jgi:putative peptidoglycan lipid II flippase
VQAMKDNYLKSAAALVIVTMLSRVFGFAREMVTANYYGATIYTDAFLVAMTIPTVLFGAVSASINNVFIPVYDSFKTQGRDKPLIFKFAFLGLAAAVLVFIVPVLFWPETAIRLFAPKFSQESVAIAAPMLQILIFVVIFRLSAAIITAVLHVNRNFIVPGITGIPYSITVALASALFARSWGIYALVWGTFMGVACQTLIMLPWAARVQLKGRFRDPCRDGLHQIGILLPPILLSSMAGQAKALVDRMFASGLAEGSISYLNYATRINELPNGLLIVSILTVIYPSLVSSINNGEEEQFNKLLANALNTILFLVIPVVAGFLALTNPIVELIYQRGEFGPMETVQTAYALRFYALGLVGMALWHLMLKGHYARKDTVTPLLATLVIVAANALLNALFIGPLQHGGLALATSLSYIIGGIILLVHLVRKSQIMLPRNTLLNCGKSVLTATVMGIICRYSYIALNSIWLPTGFVQKAILVFAVIFLGIAIYFSLALVLKTQAMDQAAEIIKKLKKKFLRNE